MAPICNTYKFGHQMAQLSLFANLTTRWHHLHYLQIWPPGCIICIATLPRIALLALSVGIQLVSSSARVASVKSQQGLRLTHSVTSGPIDRTPGLPWSDNYLMRHSQVFGCRTGETTLIKRRGLIFF